MKSPAKLSSGPPKLLHYSVKTWHVLGVLTKRCWTVLFQLAKLTRWGKNNFLSSKQKHEISNISWQRCKSVFLKYLWNCKYFLMLEGNWLKLSVQTRRTPFPSAGMLLLSCVRHFCSSFWIFYLSVSYIEKDLNQQQFSK